MNVDLEYSDLPPWDIPPLTWTRRGSTIWIACENGHRARIDERWDIAADGTVTPSIHCLCGMGPEAREDSAYYAPEPRTCGWHVFASLAGYST